MPSLKMNKFLKLCFKKLIQEACSLKVHIIALSTVLLVKKDITPSVWSQVVIAIGLGRVLIDSIIAINAKKEDNSSKSTGDPFADHYQESAD